MLSEGINLETIVNETILAQQEAFVYTSSLPVSSYVDKSLEEIFDSKNILQDININNNDNNINNEDPITMQSKDNKTISEFKDEIDTLRNSLKRRVIIIEELRKAYLRDVIEMKHIIQDHLTSDERSKIIYEFISHLPTVDLREVLVLHAPHNGEFRVKACETCGGYIDVTINDSSDILRLKEELVNERKVQQSLRIDICKHQSIIEHLERQITDNENKYINEKQVVYAELRSLRINLTEAVDKSNKLHSDNKTLRQQVHDLKSSQSIHTKVVEAVNNLSASNVELESKVHGLTDQLINKEEQELSYKTEITDLSTQITSLKSENSTLSDELGRANQGWQESRDRINRTKELIETLEQSLSSANKTTVDLELEISALNAELSEEKAAAASDILRLETMADNLRNEIRFKKEELKQSKQAHKETHKQLKLAYDALVEYEDVIKEKENDIITLAANTEDAYAEVNALKTFLVDHMSRGGNKGSTVPSSPIATTAFYRHEAVTLSSTVFPVNSNLNVIPADEMIDPLTIAQMATRESSILPKGQDRFQQINRPKAASMISNKSVRLSEMFKQHLNLSSRHATPRQTVAPVSSRIREEVDGYEDSSLDDNNVYKSDEESDIEISSEIDSDEDEINYDDSGRQEDDQSMDQLDKSTTNKIDKSPVKRKANKVTSSRINQVVNRVDEMTNSVETDNLTSIYNKAEEAEVYEDKIENSVTSPVVRSKHQSKRPSKRPTAILGTRSNKRPDKLISLENVSKDNFADDIDNDDVSIKFNNLKIVNELNNKDEEKDDNMNISYSSVNTDFTSSRSTGRPSTNTLTSNKQHIEGTTNRSSTNPVAINSGQVDVTTNQSSAYPIAINRVHIEETSNRSSANPITTNRGDVEVDGTTSRSMDKDKKSRKLVAMSPRTRRTTKTSEERTIDLSTVEEIDNQNTKSNISSYLHNSNISDSPIVSNYTTLKQSNKNIDSQVKKKSGRYTNRENAQLSNNSPDNLTRRSIVNLTSNNPALSFSPLGSSKRLTSRPISKPLLGELDTNTDIYTDRSQISDYNLSTGRRSGRQTDINRRFDIDEGEEYSSYDARGDNNTEKFIPLLSPLPDASYEELALRDMLHRQLISYGGENFANKCINAIAGEISIFSNYFTNTLESLWTALLMNKKSFDFYSKMKIVFDGIIRVREATRAKIELDSQLVFESDNQRDAKSVKQELEKKTNEEIGKMCADIVPLASSLVGTKLTPHWKSQVELTDELLSELIPKIEQATGRFVYKHYSDFYQIDKQGFSFGVQTVKEAIDSMFPFSDRTLTALNSLLLDVLSDWTDAKAGTMDVDDRIEREKEAIRRELESILAQKDKQLEFLAKKLDVFTQNMKEAQSKIEEQNNNLYRLERLEALIISLEDQLTNEKEENRNMNDSLSRNKIAISNLHQEIADLTGRLNLLERDNVIISGDLVRERKKSVIVENRFDSLELENNLLKNQLAAYVMRDNIVRTSTAVQCNQSLVTVAVQTELFTPPMSLQTVLVTKNQSSKRVYPMVFSQLDNQIDSAYENNLYISTHLKRPYVQSDFIRPITSTQFQNSFSLSSDVSLNLSDSVDNNNSLTNYPSNRSISRIGTSSFSTKRTNRSNNQSTKSFTDPTSYSSNYSSNNLELPDVTRREQIINSNQVIERSKLNNISAQSVDLDSIDDFNYRIDKSIDKPVDKSIVRQLLRPLTSSPKVAGNGNRYKSSLAKNNNLLQSNLKQHSSELIVQSTSTSKFDEIETDSRLEGGIKRDQATGRKINADTIKQLKKTFFGR